MALDHRSCALVLVIFVFSTPFASVGGVIPIVGHERQAADQPQTPGCRFGGLFYDLEATWHPNLEPSGINYCISCQCVPLFKKGVLQTEGRAVCRDIQPKCPPAMGCKTPEVPQGGCCKLCPGQVFVPHIALARIAGFTVVNRGLDALPSDSWEISGAAPQSEFISLLTVVGDASDVTSSAVANARMSLRGASLFYCITVEGLNSLRKLQILDKHGVVLHETEIKIRKRENTVCGDWFHMATPYIRWLHDQELRIKITSRKRRATLSGDIRYHPLTNEESFTGVLRPAEADGSGAVVLITADVSLRSLDFTVLFSGLGKEDLNGPCSARFTKGGSVLHSDEIHFVDKGDEVQGSWINLSKRMVKYAPRGKISFSVITSSGREYSGSIHKNTNTKVLHSLLRPASSHTGHMTSSSGAAVFELRPSGTLKYNIRVAEVTTGDVMSEIYVTNEDGTPQRMLCRVAQYVDSPRTEEGSIQMSGSCRRLNLWEVHMLQKGHVKVKITNSEVPGWELLGTVKADPQGGRQSAGNPIILSSSFSDPSADIPSVGQAWFHVDSDCQLRYDIYTEEADIGGTDVTASIMYVDRKLKQRSVALSGFLGNWSRGSLNITRTLGRTLSHGNAHILVTSSSHPDGLLGSQITVPNTCWKKKNTLANDAPRTKKQNNFMLQDQGHINGFAAMEIGHNCLVLGVMRKSGETWIPDHNTCQTCTCNLGEYVCHDVVCPEVTCSNPVSVPGDCCPQCVEETDLDQQCFFDGDLRFHSYGTRWHPYMPTSGYSTCAVCECRGDEDNGVNCGRLACPPLACHPSVAIRLSPDACCQTCPEGVTGPPMLMEEAPLEEDIPGVLDTIGSCTHQDVTYHNGATWNPVILPFGEEPCITCRCLFGHVSCERETCGPLTCERAVMIQGQCCPVCEGTRIEPVFSSIGGALD